MLTAVGLAVVLMIVSLAPVGAAELELLGKWIYREGDRTAVFEFRRGGELLVEGHRGTYAWLDVDRLRLKVGRHECRSARDLDCDTATVLGGQAVAIRLPFDALVRVAIAGDTMTVDGWMFKGSLLRRVGP